MKPTTMKVKKTTKKKAPTASTQGGAIKPVKDKK